VLRRIGDNPAFRMQELLMRPVRGYFLRLMLAHLTCIGHVIAWVSIRRWPPCESMIERA
jgi:hypothetical protein